MVNKGNEIQRPIIDGSAMVGFRALRDRLSERIKEMNERIAGFKGDGSNPQVVAVIQMYSTVLEMLVKDLDALFGGDK